MIEPEPYTRPLDGPPLPERNCTVVIADDHPSVRTGTRTILDTIGGVTVLAEAANGDEAIEAVLRHAPDIVFMDISMPERDGLSATRELTNKVPTSVLMLTAHSGQDYVTDAINAGAAGYLPKSASPQDYAEAIDAILAGESPIHPDVLKEVIHALAEERRTQQHLQDCPAQLTARLNPNLDTFTPCELEIIPSLAEGLTNAQIARSRYVAPSTIKGHVSRIFGKLGVSNRPAAVKKAVDLGLLD